MATIQKRKSGAGTSYRVMIRLKGFLPESATFDRLTDAREWASKTEADMKAGRYFGESKRHTFGELIEVYSKKTAPTLKSWCERERHLVYWLEVFGDCQLDVITPPRIVTERDKLLDGQTRRGTLRAGATVVRYLASLSGCLTYAVRELQWIERNPIERVTKPKEAKGRTRFLDDAERTALLKACKESSHPDLYFAVVMALTTGGRQAEIMCLRWSQIDFKKRTIMLRTGETKNDEARTLPLVGQAVELLQSRAKIRQLHDDRVFPTTARAKKSTMLNLRHPWVQAMKAAGIEDFHWHDLRHTSASYLMMQGVSHLEIAKILGHKSLAMVIRYTHLAPDRAVELGDALADRLGLA